MPDWVPINWDLIKHPSNWLIVILMTVFGLFVVEMVAQWATNNLNPKLPAPFAKVNAVVAEPSVSDPSTPQ